MFRSPALVEALDRALAGDLTTLSKELRRASGLPGKHANLKVAWAFANECAARGARADALVTRLATLSADEAPGATDYEFLPICGVLAAGERAVTDAKARARFLKVLHGAADDLRFRVREAVPLALARIGEVFGDGLLAECARWTDGYFHAAALLLSFREGEWLGSAHDTDALLARVDEAFQLARDASRAAARYPGYKALLDALYVAPALVALRVGPRAFSVFHPWVKTNEPSLREVVTRIVDHPKIAVRFPDEAAQLRAALEGTATPPRDPTLIRQGMRGRGKRAKSHG